MTPNEMLSMIAQLRRQRDEARRQFENLKAAAIHTCHDQCQRPMCVLRRERDEARADAARIADILSGLELRTTGELAKLERERNEARAVADELASVAAHCLGWHEHESTDAAIKIAAALKRWKKSK